MYIVKVLKRKDAASVIVAIVLAMTLVQTIFLPISQLSYKAANVGRNDINGGIGGGWRETYFAPLIELFLTLIVLEVIIRLFVWIHPIFIRTKK